MFESIHRPMIPLTVALIVGILVGEACPGWGVWVLLLGLAIGVVLAGCVAWKKAALVLPLLFFGCLGYLSIQPWVAPHFKTDHVWHYVDSPPGNIYGQVVGTPVYRHKRIGVVIAVSAISRKNQYTPVYGHVRLTIAGKPVSLSKGDHIAYTGRIRSIRNFNNPGGFDYERYMAFQKIWTRSYVRSHNLSVLDTGRKSAGRHGLDFQRHRIAAWIDRQTYPASDHAADIRAISKALLLGDRSDISRELRERFNRAGVGHLLAISGLHVGIVATAAYLLFNFLASLVPALLWAGWTRKTAAILTFIPVLIYGFLAGMSPSTQRAVLMTGVFLLTLLWDRDHDLTNTACVAAAVILIVHPPALFSISFQLSFTAVFAIVWGMTLLSSRFKSRHTRGSRLIDKLISFLAVSGFAILGTAPLVLFYFNQISLIGMVVNLVAIPLVGFLAVPFGLLGVLSLFFMPPLADIFLRVCHWLLGQAVVVITFFSDLPWAAVETITPTWFEIGLYYLTLLSVYYWLYRKTARRREQPRSRALKPMWVYVGIGLVAAGWLLDGGYWLHQRFWRHDIRVTVFDVGQGSAALLEFPQGATMLIDGGGFPGSATFDTGRNIIAPYLLRRKILTVDTIVLSHPNSDHLNGLIYISKTFNVKRVITNDQPADTMGYRTLMRTLKQRCIDTPTYRTLDGRMQFGGAQVEILHPPKDFLSGDSTRLQQDENDNSLVVKVSLGRHAILFPGDIMAAGERTLVTTNRHALKSTILIAPHHGSDTSSTPVFLSRVDPKIVVISCGWHNRFGLPSKAVLDRYAKRGCRVLRTDMDGAVLLWFDGDTLKMTSKRPRMLKATI